jgi:hypothetical protein
MIGRIFVCVFVARGSSLRTDGIKRLGKVARI